MNQFIVFCVFALSLASVFEARNLETGFQPGKCPEPTRLAKPFDLKQFLGTWYEIKSTQPFFEKNQRCIQANYKLDTVTGDVVVNNIGIDANDIKVLSVGTTLSLTSQDNVFAVKFFPLSPSSQYWVIDTDYTGYALTVSCNNATDPFNFRDVWIISRQPKLDAEIIKTLEAKLDSVGITGTQLFDTVQNC